VCPSILRIQYSKEHKILLRKTAVGMEYISDLLFQLTCKYTRIYTFTHTEFCVKVGNKQRQLSCALWLSEFTGMYSTDF